LQRSYAPQGVRRQVKSRENQGTRAESEARARLERARRHRRHRLVFFCFVLVAMAVSGLFILSVLLQVMVAQNEMRVREIERQVELERRQQEELRVGIASLESPTRIEKIAAEDLGMEQVTKAEYLKTPAFLEAKARELERLRSGEELVSEAGGGGGGEE
jgi:cell division protein FtsL